MIWGAQISQLCLEVYTRLEKEVLYYKIINTHKVMYILSSVECPRSRSLVGVFAQVVTGGAFLGLR